MKIYALILAGGIGKRMQSSVPKQFILVNGCPIVVSTIMNFEKNDRIDGVLVVCVKDYIKKMNKMINDFNLKKVIGVINGGETGHDSSEKGISFLSKIMSDDDFVIIHDAVRPILPQDILNGLIDKGIERGNACLAIPCYETVIKTSDYVSGSEEINRNSFLRVQTPQIYNFKFIKELYLKSNKDNKHDFIYANSMAVYYGNDIFFAKGFNYNFKITTPEDLVLYKAIVKAGFDK